MSIKVKPCPICGIGKPRMVHYAKPMKTDPDGWEETDDGVFEPIVTYKHIECSNCGAYAVGLNIDIDRAVRDWNSELDNGHRNLIVQHVCDEELEVDNG